jgi:hypothetical protein
MHNASNAVVSHTTGAAIMAFDAFMKIDGIPGESTGDKHKEWIEISSFAHGVEQPATRQQAVQAEQQRKGILGDIMKTYCLYASTLAFTFAGMCFASSDVNAGEVPFPQCPQKLSVQQNLKSVVSDDWKPVDQNPPASLAYISVTAGEYPIEQTGFNVPSGEEKMPNGDVVVYFDELIPNFRGIHNYWIVCRYYDTSIELVQKIPENVTRCEFTALSKHPSPISAMIKCFDIPRGRTK